MEIHIEVVFASADKQRLLEVSLPQGATVADAILKSELTRQFPGVDFDALEVGVWGHVVSRDHVLADRDRVEIYRSLEIDPREARRQLALHGRTMGAGPKD